MLKPQQIQSIKTFFPLQTPFLHGNGGHAFLLQVQLRPSFNKPPKVRVGFSSANNIKAVATPSATVKSLSVKAVVTVEQTATDKDDIQDRFGKSLLLELVSAQLDPMTGLEKATVKAHKAGTEKVGDVTYVAEFEVPEDFGEVGAILVENEHHKEMFLKDVVLDGFPNGPITINCDSRVQSKHDNKPKRAFFTNKSYLPSQTPNGLKRLRGEELNKLRGNGQGERQTGDRIYDYDVYNDIGDPDRDLDLERPVLGCKQHPYPRRGRTGRPRCKEGQRPKQHQATEAPKQKATAPRRKQQPKAKDNARPENGNTGPEKRNTSNKKETENRDSTEGQRSQTEKTKHQTKG